MSVQQIDADADHIDFPDAEEVRDLTTSKEELFKAKKKSFINSLGGDIVNRAKNQGETNYSATLAANFLGLTSDDQIRMLDEVKTFLEKQGYKISVVEKEQTDANQKTFLNRTITVDWSN